MGRVLMQYQAVNGFYLRAGQTGRSQPGHLAAHSIMPGTGGNRSFFDNEEVVACEKVSRSRCKREQISSHKIPVEEQPSVFIRQAQSANAIRSEVEGLYINHFNKPDFRNVTINEQ